jgi:superoxide dismutase, Cu-Zn family
LLQLSNNHIVYYRILVDSIKESDMQRYLLPTIIVCAITLTACQSTANNSAVGTSLAASARAIMKPTANSSTSGELRFEVDNGAIRMLGDISGLKANAEHAIHVHEKGDCSAPDATSAGAHFNPDGQAHGNRASGAAHHAGDMPNINSDANGNARVDIRLENIELSGGGARDIANRAVIIHANPDDYTTQPTGNAGGRIACGVIELLTAPDPNAGAAD